MRCEYPATPVIAVGAIITHQDRLVLVRRAKEPSKGRWTFPGGAVELGESLQDAVQRLQPIPQSTAYSVFTADGGLLPGKEQELGQDDTLALPQNACWPQFTT